MHILIEPLESRIAPASVLTYIDVDGDKVKIASSAGDLTGHASFDVTGHQLQKLDLTDASFQGANITFTVTKVPGSDGLANVGYIDAMGRDLGNVVVKGDLGRIDAGDGTNTAPALKKLAVNSLGRLDIATQAAGGSLSSNIVGPVKTVMVKGDIVNAILNVTGGAVATNGTLGSLAVGGSVVAGSVITTGTIGKVKIAHDLQGGAVAESGKIETQESIGSLAIGGSIIGGSNSDTGFVNVFATSGGGLGNVAIGGSIVGGQGDLSGLLFSFGTVGTVKVGHDVLGGSGSAAGGIMSTFDLGNVTIGGSLVGGSNDGTGQIFSAGGNAGTIKIGGDLVGGSIAGAASTDGAGSITVNGHIASVTVGGSIIAGTDTSTGDLSRSGSVRAADDIGSMTVKGSLIGNATAPVVISARGQHVVKANATTDVALGTLTVGGRVDDASILLGYGTDLTPLNADAGINSVKVGGDWVASNLVAGVVDGGNGFGNSLDSKISGAGTTDLAGVISKIAKVAIGGQVIGTPASISSTDSFGFVAQEVVSIKIGTTTYAFGTTPHDTIKPIGATGDVTVLEVA